jgi:hypothetical protein
MNIEYPTEEVPATPEYVLEVLRDGYRFCAIERKEPEWALSFETPFSDFQNDFLDHNFDAAWTCLGRIKGLCDLFRIECNCTEWESLCNRPNAHTILDVCNRISRQMVTRPGIKPWPHIDGDCLSAGAFLTVRAMLAQRGVDVRHLTPSSPLDEIAFDHWDALYWRLMLLHPGSLPIHNWKTSLASYVLSGISCLLLFCSVILIFPAAIFLTLANPILGILGFVVLAGSVIGTWRLYQRSQRPPFTRIAWGPLHTFRDLSYALAGQQPRRRIQPSS